MELGLLVLGIALAVWLLTSKATRVSVGNSTQESAMLVEQSLKISRATAYAEAEAEFANLSESLEKSNAFLGHATTKEA